MSELVDVIATRDLKCFALIGIHSLGAAGYLIAESLK